MRFPPTRRSLCPALTETVNVGWTPREFDDWGALGARVGYLAGDYWQLPMFTGIVLSSDEMKHFGAAAY